MSRTISNKSSLSSSSTTTAGCSINIQSVLRLRPLSKKERDDRIVLEHRPSPRLRDPPTAVLLPFQVNLSSPPPSISSNRLRADSDATTSGVPREYHFNHILSTEVTQDKAYHTVGLPMVTKVMDSIKRPTKSHGPKTELLICMGVVGSGKSHTCFGGYPVPKRRTPNDGLVTRMVDGMFSQSKHLSAGNFRNFVVGITVTQIAQGKSGDSRACQIQDLVGTSQLSGIKNLEPSPSNVSPVPKKRLASVRSMVATFERTVLPSQLMSPVRSNSDVSELDAEDPHPTIIKCKEGAEAREALQSALSTGRRTAKGHESSHILVTIEPYVNGNPSGEKIAILDMAGLEKGKRNNHRGKDRVANGNQAANAAVLHCLRTLQHNTNVLNGNMDALEIECVDDAASEISCVSQEKDSFKTRTKTVPFPQHKLTMVLSHLFRAGGSANVTLCLAAYPGHVDYYEKKLLLQDLELLCGSSLLRPSVANTGLDENDEEDGSLLTADSSYGYSTTSSFDSDEPKDDSDSYIKPRERFKPIVVAKLRSQFSEDSMDRSHAPSSKRPIPDVGKVTLPPAFAPPFRAPTAVPSAPPDLPSPKVVEPLAPPPPPHNPSFVSDFPGVVLPRKVDDTDSCTKVTTIVASAMVGGPNTRAPPSPKKQKEADSITSEKKGTLDPKPIIISSAVVGGLHAKPPPSPQEKEKIDKEPKTRTEGYKSRLHANPGLSSKIVPRSDLVLGQGLFQAVPHEPRRSHREREENRGKEKGKVHEKSKIKDKGSKEQSSTSVRQRLKYLEAQVKELNKQKLELASKCDSLEKENRQLKNATAQLEQARRLDAGDEEQWESLRQQRLEEQELVQSPLWEHVDSVNRTYEIKNQWCMTQKPHFSLKYPGQFERAPKLDARDRALDHTQDDNAAESKIPRAANKRSSLRENMNVLRSSIQGIKRPTLV